MFAIRIQGKQHPDIEGLRWVIKALSKDVIGYKLQHILCEDGWFVGCDGHRMHVYEHAGKYPPGLYSVAKNNKSEIVLLYENHKTKVYPDWKAVFPPHDGKQRVFAGEWADGCEKAYAHALRMYPENRSMNYDYFRDMIRDQVGHLYYYGPDNPTAFCTLNKIALIMPMR